MTQKIHGNTAGRSAEDITSERGADYGHPLEQFDCVEKMMTNWRAARTVNSFDGVSAPIERALRHTVYMILAKLSRAATNPLLMDNWADIKGYAKCFEMCVEREIANQSPEEAYEFDREILSKLKADTADLDTFDEREGEDEYTFEEITEMVIKGIQPAHIEEEERGLAT